MHLLRAFVLVTVINAGYGSVLDRTLRDSPGIEWSYDGDDGPQNWPGLCQTGHHQSPINIKSGPSIKTLYGLPLILDSAYKETRQFTAAWNGHAYAAQFSNPDSYGILAGGSLDDAYIFNSLHVHWGSEHTFDKKRYSAEMHLVHYNARYSLEEAGHHDDGYAVIGILLKEVDHPPTSEMSDFLEAITRDSNKPFKAKLRDILPKHLEPWYRYKGSLTTPGCSENVKWTVLEKVVLIRKGIIKPNEENFEPSYRPIQPLNNRTLYRSFSLFDKHPSLANANQCLVDSMHPKQTGSVSQSFMAHMILNQIHH